MNAGGTMMRVYDTLKTRLLAGGFRQGARLDPARLARTLDASATPVRDALNRLAGERLVDSLEHEGFRAPQIGEAALRDRYEWSGELLGLVARAAFRHGLRPAAASPLAARYGDAVADSFQALARLSPNHEHRAAVASLVDRTALLRLVEADLITHAMADVRRIVDTLAAADPIALRQALDHFHRERLRIVPALAARLRDYPDADA